MRSFLQIIAAAAISGILLALALPPSDHCWLGGFCFVPLLWAVSGRGLIRGFLGGILTPVFTYLAITSNLLYHVPEDRGTQNWVMVGCGFFGFLIAILASVASETKLSGRAKVQILACTAVTLEFLLFPVLPAHLALTQYRSPGMLVLASVGGIWLVSLLLWAANIGIAEAVRLQDRKLGLSIVVCVMAAYGLAFLPSGAPGARTKVAAIQTEMTDPPNLEKLNAEAAKQGAEVAIWPEFSGLEMASHGDTKELRDLSAKTGQTAFVTTFRDDHEPLPHNTAALFRAGEQSDWYFKRKVFGGERNMHTPGETAGEAQWPGHAGVGLNICYDSCYPRIISETASLSGVGLIALPTIDPNGTNSFIAAVHAAFTPFRAAESGLPIVRADGVSYSMIVDNTGRIVAELGPQKEAILVGSVSLTHQKTIYSLLGDWVLYLCILVCLSWIFARPVVAWISRSEKSQLRDLRSRT